MSLAVEAALRPEQMAARLDELHARIGPRFARAEARARARRYCTGLLSSIERKNGWQMAEFLAETGPPGAQRQLHAAEWDADAVRDDLREYVIAHRGDDPGVLVAGEEPMSGRSW